MSDVVSTLFLIYELWTVVFQKQNKAMKNVGFFSFLLGYLTLVPDEASQSIFASPFNMECVLF